MIGTTLSQYIAMRFLGILLSMILGLAFLIIAVDFIEQLRRVPAEQDVPLGTVLAIAALRAPLFIEKAFPFACLFAAMMTLTQLNNKLELVVSRAAGVSAWQFLLPIGLVAAIVGVLVSMFYNPVAISASKTSEKMIASIIDTRKTEDQATERGLWIKQEDPGGGYTILNAELARDNGRVMDNVKLISFSKDFGFVKLREVRNMVHRGDYWQLTGISSMGVDGTKTTSETEKMPTSLTQDELLGINSAPDQISFWKLREVAERVEKSGTNGLPFLVHYHSLTALPLFLLAMVLVAASVSLRFVRFGQTGRMIFGGIMSGFVLYTLTSLVTSLGSNGVVPPAVAAWAPCLVAILFGMSALLHQEDG